MGLSPSDIKAAAQAQNAEDEKMANDSLNSLMELAKKNLEIFHLSILNLESNKNEIPISKVLKSVQSIKCGVSSNSDQLKDAINGLLSDVVNGNFLGAISHVIGVGLDTLFGNLSGSMNEVQSNSVSVGVLGGFFRIDYYMYAYEFTSAALTKLTKNVVCTSVVISSVKTDDLTENDVNAILQLTFGDLPHDQLKALQADVYKALGFKNPSDKWTAQAIGFNKDNRNDDNDDDKDDDNDDDNDK